MGHGYKHGTSGGKKENPLNFAVVAYPSEVELNTATPEAFTIGVVTTNPITGWHFTVEQPEKLEEGELWFATGDSSEVAFNALKENTIQIYLTSVKQWVSGALRDVTAKIYQDGTWVDLDSTDWDAYLVYKGKTKKTTEVSTGVTRNDTDEAVRFVNNTEWSNNWVLFEDVDLTDWNSLKIEGSFSPHELAWLIVWPNNVTPNLDVNSVAKVNLTANGATLSISALSGVYKVGITWCYHSIDYPIHPTITNFYMK